MMSYAEYASRLDETAINRAALDLSEVRQGQPMAIVYCPGDMTRYDLVFTPLSAIAQVGPDRVPSGLGGEPEPGWCIVAKVNGSHPWSFVANLRTGEYQAPGYLAVHAGLGPGDAAEVSAVTALLRAFVGEPIVSA